MSGRIDTPFLDANAGVLTRVEKTPDGATIGVMEFTAVTAVPTAEGNAHFRIAGLHSSGVQNAAPNTLFFGADLNGGDGTALFRIGYWNPKAAMWSMTSAFRVMGKAELANATNYAESNAYTPTVPRSATLGYIQVVELPGSGTLRVYAARDHL
jgi:hypothetical protein